MTSDQAKDTKGLVASTESADASVRYLGHCVVVDKRSIHFKIR